MAEVIRATWEDLGTIVASARQELMICTPYYTSDGINRLFDQLQGAPQLRFITRLSPSDWLSGVSDPETLTGLIELMSESGRDAELVINQRLHAKAYISDKVTGLVGSANLSTGGFQGNFELMVRLQGSEANTARNLIHEEAKQHGRLVMVQNLRLWIDEYKGEVSRLRAVEDHEPEQLADMQRQLDTMLGHGSQTHTRYARSARDMADFAQWLQLHRNLAGVLVLLDRHWNTSGQNLTGHFKQSYYGVANFLLQNEGLIDPLGRRLDEINSDDVFQPDEDLLDAWVQYLDLHATDRGDVFDHAVLRGILPPGLGGTRLGGGGGSSTFKRMLPLVARFLSETED